MAVYFCKCGRQVNKSTNADNTGNRDTAQCTGCPYLLPWGPDKYIEGQGFRKEVQGFECRMSPTISYTTTYNGQANDKCTLRILSLDLDFLDTVQAWIDDHAADTLSAGFSRGSMRGTDFSDKGRYSLSIRCAQNKKGMAAKAALIEQFFTGGRVRKDMTLVQEKAHILAAIRRGKENASKMNYIISQHDNGLLYAYHLGTFWFWLADKRWVPSDFAKQEYEKAQKKNPRITPEEFMDSDDFIQMDDYEVPSQKLSALKALTPADSQVPAPDDREITKAPPAAAPDSGEEPEIVDECSGAEDGFPGWVRPMVEAFLQFDFVRELPAFTTAAFKNSEPVRHHWGGSLANGLYDTDPKGISFTVFRSDNSDQYREAHYTWADFVRRCKAAGLAPEPHQDKEDAPCNTEPTAPNGAAAATTDGRAAPEPSQAAETSTGSPGNSADASNCPSAEPAPQAPAALPLSAPDTAPTNLPAFDYSGLDDQTVAVLHLAESEIREARQAYISRLSAAVAAAHEAVVANCENGAGGKFIKPEGTFFAWCASVGLKKDAAYRLLQVNALLSGATPEEQATLESASPSLLYAAAKPSAPAELVQAVKDGDITSHKQYQDLLARFNAEKAAREKAEHEAALDRKEQEDANSAALRYKNECDRRAQDQQRLEGLVNTAKRERDDARRQATEAENRAAGAQKLAEQRGTENTELKAKIRELENQPRDVAVVQPGEEQIEAWRREGADRMAATMQETVRRANQEKLNAQSQVADLQQQLATARPDADACQRTADILYETAENLRILLRTQLKQAQLSPTAYGKVVAHVLQVARTLLDTVRVCSPDGYDMDSEEDDDFE